jgi:hypothetical protein
MTAKTSLARRNAFLKALAETGNQTLAAERAKVSRSWVCLHRANDPAFDADCVAAIAAAKERFGETKGSPSTSSGRAELGMRGSRRPPAGWRFAGGEELVVSGSRGRRVQVRRAKLKQWTPRVEDRFLSALAASCNVKAALVTVGMSKSGAYSHRARWPAFARAWDEAIAIGYARLEAAVIESADHFFDPDSREGVEIGEEPLHGMSVGLAIQLLRMYRAKAQPN